MTQQLAPSKYGPEGFKPGEHRRLGATGSPGISIVQRKSVNWSPSSLVDTIVRVLLSSSLVAVANATP